MAKTKISEFSATPGNNTDIDGINIAEGCAPSGINDAIRELMSQLKDFQAGTAGDSFNGPVGTTTAAAGAFTTLSSTGNTTLGDASGDSVTINGNANFANVNPTLTAGTANGVAYLNGSKVLTTGSALTFDGTTLTQSPASAVQAVTVLQEGGGSSRQLVIKSPAAGGLNGSIYTVNTSAALEFGIGGSEQMRLTSTGLGIGTSSPGTLLQVGSSTASATAKITLGKTTATTEATLPTIYCGSLLNAGAGLDAVIEAASSSGGVAIRTGGSTRVAVDASGNVGIGTSSPVEKVQSSKGIAATGANQSVGSLDGFVADYSSGVSRLIASRNGVAAGTMTFWTTDSTGTAAERMRLDSSGNLGIGTSSPGYKLDVDRGASNGVVAKFGRSSGQSAFIYADTNAAYFASNAAVTNGLGFYDSSNYFAVFTNSAERMRLDSSGNLGLGVTPSAFSASYKGFEIGAVGNALTSASTVVNLSTNAIRGASWTYGTTGRALLYQQDSGAGSHAWYNAASGSGTITFTQAMTLDASGNLGIGTSSPGARLDLLSSASGMVARFKSSSTYGVVVADNSNTTGGGAFAARQNGTQYSIFGVDGAVQGNTSTDTAIFADGTGCSIKLYTNGSSTLKAILDSSGNLGLGVTPSAWNSSTVAVQLGNYGSLFAFKNSGNVYLNNNSYTNSVGNEIYLNTAPAGRYRITDNTHVWYNAPSGTAGNAISFTQAMTLDASGNLGVGLTSTGGARFAVQGSSTSAYLTVGDGTATMLMGAGASLSSDSSIPYLRSNNSIGFATGGGTERARIDSSGNLLVGQTVANASTVGASVRATGRIFSSLSTNNGTDTFTLYSTAAGSYRFYVLDTGNIYATNTTITGISDQRWKENIRSLDDGLEKIMALQPRKFDWKEGKGTGDKNSRGFIAQEFEQVFPDLVSEWKDPAPEGEEPYKSVRADLIPVLVKAIQEQQTQISDQLALINSLKARLDAANL